MPPDFFKLEAAFESYPPAALYFIFQEDDYRGLEEINSSNHCRWLGTPGVNDIISERTVSVVEDSDPEFGAIRLTDPKFYHEKRNAGYSGAYLIGRQAAGRKILDVSLATTARDKQLRTISRLHFGVFRSREFNNRWKIQGLDGQIVVNDIFWPDKSTGPVLLKSHQPNSIRIGKLELWIVCNPSYAPENLDWYAMSSLHLDAVDESRTNSTQSSMSTLSTVNRTSQSSKQGNVLYLYPDVFWESPRGYQTKNILATDPWSGEEFVAKPYPMEERHALEIRIRDFEAFNSNDPFVYDVDLIVQDEQLYALNPIIEDAETLAMHNPIDEHFARRLLLNGLPCLARLHDAKLAHNDINPGTLLIKDGNPELLLIAGFSERSPVSAETASSDCYQFFRTVRRCLGQSASELKSSWIGISLLDDLWVQSNNTFETWSHDAQGICSKLKLGHRDVKQWMNFRVSKFVPIRCHYEDNRAWLHIDDVKQYLYLTVLAEKEGFNNWSDIQSTTENIAKGLSARKSEQEYIDEDSYGHLCSHLKEYHRTKLSLESLISHLPSPTKHETSFTLCVTFRVPYNVRYGIFHVEYLSWINPLIRGSVILQQLVPKSFEIRGDKKFQGTYLSTKHLADIAQALELSFDENSIHEGTDQSMEKFSYHEWFFGAPNESSEIFPVNRETEQVQLGPGKQISYNKFLETFFPNKAQLDAVVQHNPQWLLSTESASDIEHSCQGSIDQSETLEMGIGFRRRKQTGFIANSRKFAPVQTVKEDSATERIAGWLAEKSSKRRKLQNVT